MRGELTQLINAAGAGERAAADALWREIYDEVHAMARRTCREEGPRTLLQPTLLVHEAFLKVFRGPTAPTIFENRRHFWGAMTRAMSQHLIDAARTEKRRCRGGDWVRVHLEVVSGELRDPTRALSPLAIKVLEALDKLSELSPECAESAEVARLRYVAGLSVEETAVLLEIPRSSVLNHWKFARSWLRREISRAS